jgi:hypothetical protein
VCVAQLEKKKEREKAFLSQATVASRRIRLGMNENKECVTLLHYNTFYITLWNRPWLKVEMRTQMDKERLDYINYFKF